MTLMKPSESSFCFSLRCMNIIYYMNFLDLKSEDEGTLIISEQPLNWFTVMQIRIGSDSGT